MECTACRCENCALIRQLVLDMADQLEILKKRVKKVTTNPGAIVATNTSQFANQLANKSDEFDMTGMEAWNIKYIYNDRLGSKNGTHTMFMAAGSHPYRETIMKLKAAISEKCNLINKDAIAIHSIVAVYNDGREPATIFNSNNAEKPKRRINRQYDPRDLEDTASYADLEKQTPQQLIDSSLRIMNKDSGMQYLGWNPAEGRACITYPTTGANTSSSHAYITD